MIRLLIAKFLTVDDVLIFTDDNRAEGKETRPGYFK